MKDVILVVGSSGQIGTDLVIELRKIYGDYNVVASDIKRSSNYISQSGPFEELDILNEKKLIEIIKKYKITQIYLLAALLSARAEKEIEMAWKLNTQSHLNVLNLLKNKLIKKVFWPSSIAVFGSNTPKHKTPQHTIMEPSTVYGISKQTGERWNEYYFNKFNSDIRSLRYPGLIGWRAKAGGGTTDYAVNIFHDAINESKYSCFLKKDTVLPMMYMPDAIRSTIEIMEAPSEKVKIRSSYNIAGVSFSPEELALEIKKVILNFEISYKADFRQQIAESWPESIDDIYAQKDWHWKANYNLQKITRDMLTKLKLPVHEA